MQHHKLADRMMLPHTVLWLRRSTSLANVRAWKIFTITDWLCFVPYGIGTVFWDNPVAKVVFKNTKGGCWWGTVANLAAEAVQGAALALERVHHVQRSDGLAAGVLGVGDSVADDVLQEHLQDAAGLLVDEAADALHTAAASQPPDGRLRDALLII